MDRLRKKLLKRLDDYFSSDVLSLGQLGRMFLPILWEQIFFAVFSLISIWMLTLVGDEAVSVVNMMTVIGQVFLSVCLGLCTGGTVLVAQSVGGGRTGRAAHATVQTMGFAVVFTTLLAGVLLLLRGPVVGYLLEGADPGLISQAVLYFVGFCVSFPFYALYQGFAGCMRGWGRTRAALLPVVAVQCAELALTALFVLGWRMGVAGVALALVLSRLGGAVLAMVMLFRHRLQLELWTAYLRPNLPILGGILRIAAPLALEQFFFNSGKAVSQRFIAGYGTAHMAAGGVVNAIFNLINIPQISLRTVTVTVVGMCIGRGRSDLAARYVDRFLRALRVSLLALLPVSVGLSAWLVQSYRLEPSTRQLTYLCLAVILAFAPWFIGGSFLAPAGLRAGGDGVYASAVSLGCMWLVRVTLSYLLTQVFQLGVVGLNIAMVVEWALRTGCYRLRLNGHLWYKHQLIAER